MIKRLKKTAAIAFAVAMVAANGVTAFAATNSVSTTGYGTLYGSLTSAGSYVTSVSKNTDNAKLTISGTIQDKLGNTVATQQTIYSDRGATSFAGKWSKIPSNSYALYGTHGVQNGTTYGAAATYTVTHVN